MTPDSDEASQLDQLQEKIQQLKAQNRKPPEAPQATPGLVFSVGLSVLGALWVGEQFGRYLSQKAGNPQYLLVGWVSGFGLAGLTVYRLLRPYMK